jgi:hypothetical protein
LAKKMIMIIVVALCLLVAFLPLVKADSTSESFTVFTERSQYLVGETINVFVKAEAIDPNQTITVTDVVVFDPNNASVAEWHNTSIVLTYVGEQQYVGSVVGTLQGEYTVSANATGCLWILRCFWHFFCIIPIHHVVPEVPIGTIAASASMILALGAYVAVPRLRRKRQI